MGGLGRVGRGGSGGVGLVGGRARGVVEFYSGGRRGYEAGFRFGFATDTYDSDGEAQGPDSAPALDAAILEKFACERIGRFEQTPPSFSAKKVKGRPAYELARKKLPVELKAVEVEIYEYRLKETAGSIARFVIECSSGTYIRSLAHEMGQRLGCGAHLAEITRTAVGAFCPEQTITLEELAEAKQAVKFADYLIPLESLLSNLPRANLLPVVERRVRHGTKFNITLAQLQPGRVEPP